MSVRYKRALDDIEQIRRYIAEFDPVAVKRVVRQIVVHRVRNEAVDIIAVLHTARKRRS
jgi:plasmid stabilization system protein ParE